jgi:hypothetical protein
MAVGLRRLRRHEVCHLYAEPVGDATVEVIE